MNILLVDDEHDSRDYLAHFLRALEHTVFEAVNAKDALQSLNNQPVDLVMSDIKMPGMTGLEMLKSIRRKPLGGDVSVVLFTGYADLHMAIDALRSGADDFLLKPVKIDEIVRIIRENENRLPSRERRKKKRLMSEEGLLQAASLIEYHPSLQEWSNVRPSGRNVGIFSREMSEVYAQARLLHGDWSYPVMIEGETGTGKELLARYIHFGDESSLQPFIDLNCAAIAPTMFESEFFGYEAGAFTGGQPKGQKGKLDLAQGGTMFLDEFTEISPAMQAKLLRVLEEGEFYRVGGLKKIQTDARIICATNADIEDKVFKGEFRSDLYYRLNVARIRIPSLRERPDDIVPLALMFLQDMAAQRNKSYAGISPDAEKILLAYHWPGNIRELRNVMAWAVLNCKDVVALELEHVKKLQMGIRRDLSPELTPPAGQKSLVLPEEGFSLENITADIVKEALLKHGGNKAQTARYLGISRQTLYTWMKKNQPQELNEP